MKKTIVFSFGRMSPPTIGHEKLANKIMSVAKDEDADAAIYLSHSFDPKKNPLPYREKVNFAKIAFGEEIVRDSAARNALDVAKEVSGEYSHLIMVVGSDRVSEFDRILKKYNKKDYDFEEIKVVSAGDRDSDAEGVSGMSASKMRAAAADGDFSTFESGLPTKLVPHAQAVFGMIRQGMN